MVYYFFVLFLLLSSCISNKKNSYSSARDYDSVIEGNSVSRQITSLNNISQFEERNFEFITNQIKEVVKKYSKVTAQLLNIESKLDKLITDQEKIRSRLETQTENMSKKQETLSKDFKADLENEVTLKETSISSGAIESDRDIFDESLEDGKSSTVLLDEIATGETTTNPEDLTLKQARYLFQSEKYDEAILLFQKYRSQNPEGTYLPEAIFYIGESFRKLNSLKEAELFFKELIQFYPQSPWASQAKSFIKE